MTGSHDKYLILAETDGTVLRTWPSAHIHDLAISSDGRLLFSVTSEKKVGFLCRSSVGCMYLMRLVPVQQWLNVCSGLCCSCGVQELHM